MFAKFDREKGGSHTFCPDIQYFDGIPAGSRLALHKDTFKKTVDSMNTEEGLKRAGTVSVLAKFAETGLSFSGVLSSHRSTISSGYNRVTTG